MPVNIQGPVPRWAQLGLICLGGVALIASPSLLHSYFSEGFLHVLKDVGIAVLVAGILGFTIDRWFKADLAKDVFEAVTGGMFPPAFREEIRNIVSHKFVCERHKMKFTIEHVTGKDYVRVTTKIERTLKNIGPKPEPMRAYLFMDDWGFDMPSVISECYLEKSDGTQVHSGPVEYPDSRLTCTSEDVMVPAQGEIKSLSMCHEYKRINDEVSFHFSAPTQGPEIEVDAKDFHFEVGFGPEAPQVETDTYAPRQTLKGTYFPGQRMRVRWWPKRPVERTDT